MNAADTILSVHESSARSDAAYALSVDTSPIASEAGESSREWRPAPGEVVSLWDMLRVHGNTFVMMMNALRDTRSIIDRQKAQEEMTQVFEQSSTPRPSEVKEALAEVKKDQAVLHDEIILAVSKHMEVLTEACVSLEMPASLAKAGWIQGILVSASEFSELSAHIKELEIMLKTNWENELFGIFNLKEASILMSHRLCSAKQYTTSSQRQ